MKRLPKHKRKHLPRHVRSHDTSIRLNSLPSLSPKHRSPLRRVVKPKYSLGKSNKVRRILQPSKQEQIQGLNKLNKILYTQTQFTIPKRQTYLNNVLRHSPLSF